MEQREFLGIWIPREIWLNEDLSLFEKMLLVEITSLDGEKGCFASNAYFAKFFGIIERNVIKHISQLKEKGLIYQESFDGRQRVLRSKLNSALSISTGLTRGKRQVSPVDIDTHNNTVNNTSTLIVSEDTQSVDVTPAKKPSRIKKKKDFVKLDLPSKNEVFSFMGDTKGTSKFYNMLTLINLQQNLTVEQIKETYDWMIEFFMDKYEGQFYRDPSTGNYVGTAIVMDEMDKFTGHYAEHQEEEIKNIRARLMKWITNSVKYNK